MGAGRRGAPAQLPLLLAAAAALAAASTPALAVCNTCHLRYHHKEVASPTAFPSGGACARYAAASCCTAATAASVHGDALYGEEYRWDRCGPLSPACQAWFVDEACLYECDVNAGKFRRHANCTAEGANSWEMRGMPMRASECDAWYADCRADLFCVDGGSRSFFDLPTCDRAGCRRFGDIYANGSEMCEVLWAGAFRYERDESAAYTFRFAEGEPNPNNLVMPLLGFPDRCPDFGPAAEACPTATEQGLVAHIAALQRQIRAMAAAPPEGVGAGGVTVLSPRRGGSGSTRAVAAAGLAVSLLTLLLLAAAVARGLGGRGGAPMVARKSDDDGAAL